MFDQVAQRVAAWARWCAIVGTFLFGGFGLLLFCGQLEVWLRTGTWLSLPISYMFVPHAIPDGADAMAVRLLQSVPRLWLVFPIQDFQTWLMEPTTWLGLHRAVDAGLDFVSFPVLVFGSSQLAVVWLLSSVFAADVK